MQLGNAHFLICRTDNIGDLVLTLPMAGFLKQRFPDCRISVLCRDYARGVLAHCRFVDQILTLEELQRHAPPGADPVRHLANQLEAQNIDVALFAFPHRLLARAARVARIPWRVGTSHRLWHWLYCNKLAHFSRVHSPLHEAQLNFALLKPLGIDEVPDLNRLRHGYGLQAHDRTQVAATSAAPAWLSDQHFNLILHPKSNGNGREWPPGHFYELARQLQADPRIRIIISGSAAEGEWLTEHMPALLALPHVSPICGKLNLAEFVDVIARADGLVASGTGPLHVSAALGRPTLGLFPPRKPIDIARWGALGAEAQNLAFPTPCRACPGAHDCACMAAIDVEQVKQVILAWVANWAASRADAAPA